MGPKIGETYPTRNARSGERSFVYCESFGANGAANRSLNCRCAAKTALGSASGRYCSASSHALQEVGVAPIRSDR
jgi:hypothetical protein